MTAAVAVGAIDLYQRFVSPYKGFRCAHRVRRGGRSCSQFAKRLVERVGLLRFGPLLMRRLRKCGETARAMKAGLLARGRRSAVSKADLAEDDRRRRDQQPHGSAPDACGRNWGDCGTAGCDVPTVPDLSGCDGASLPDAGCDGCACDLSL
jgi:putative component of membrane protein insertase Oxa1/YidC/SpoIIIJ protein YidD